MKKWIYSIFVAFCVMLQCGCAQNEPAVTPEKVVISDITETTKDETNVPGEPRDELAETSSPKPTAEAVAEPTAEPASEPVPEPTSEPGTEPTADPVTEAASESTPEPTAVPAQEPLPKPVANPKDDKWIITSHRDQSGNQGMFYTIRNEAKNVLVAVDGGWEGNTDYVRKTIKAYGGHVNAWIVTHFHNDHVDAFNGVYGEFTIDTIYDSPIDYEKFLTVAQSWDSKDSFDKYRENTKDATNIVHVNRGDVIDLAGLKIEFFNTYDADTAEVGDMPNNAALVFKVTNVNESMLFMSDVSKTEMESILTEKYGDRLKADYLQPGHHGNNSFTDGFYDLVKPKKIICDAPEVILTNENLKAKNLVSYCNNNGIEYVCYSQAPNSIELK